MSEGIPTYRQRWLAYFDLLGFADRVRLHSLPFMLDQYQEILKFVEKAMPENGSQGTKSEVQCKWASDTFLLYTERDCAQDFASIESFSRLFFSKAVMKRIPLRGCITVGDFHADEGKGIFIGPALVEACKCAEAQQWLGFVLTPAGRNRLEQLCEDDGGDSFSRVYGDSSDYYIEYDVPMTFSGEDTSGVRKCPCYAGRFGVKSRRLLAYRADEACAGSPSAAQDYWLWHAVEQMSHTAPADARRKYRNTMKFLLDVCPELRRLVVDRHRQVRPPPL